MKKIKNTMKKIKNILSRAILSLRVFLIIKLAGKYSVAINVQSYGYLQRSSKYLIYKNYHKMPHGKYYLDFSKELAE